MSGKAAVLIFPGTNSEDETLRILQQTGIDAELVHWSRGEFLPRFDAYVLPGGFAYEDRIRAGAIPAHDRMMDHVIDGALAGKPVLGICNGAQILLEAGLVPGTGEVRRPTAAFARNAQRHFISKHVWVRLAIEPTRSLFTAHLEAGARIPAWASHGEGRLAANESHLREIVAGAHVAFTYEDGAPNGSALDCAALVNQSGNVLAIMPHPERDAWNFNHPNRSQGTDPNALSGGSAFFQGLARALK